MLPVVVVIDVVPADVPVERAQALVDACSGALAGGVCGLASTTPESARPSAVAMVLWQAPGFLEATVRVGRPDHEWATRRLSFSEADPPQERWVAAGLTVATLLDETRPEPPPTPSSEVSGSPIEPRPSAPRPPLLANATPPAKPVSVAEAQRRSLGVSAGLLVGNGWDEGGAMTGGWATLMLNAFQERFFVLAGGSLAGSGGPALANAGRLTSRWLGFELGGGVQASIRPFRFYAAPEVAFQSVSAALPERGSMNDHELQLKLRWGAVWEASSRWGLGVGAAMRVLPIEVPSSDPERVRRSGTSGELQVGVEFWP